MPAKKSEKKVSKTMVTPRAMTYHDKKKFSIDVELPGVDKENIEFQMSDTSFCVKAPMEDTVYFGCWMIAHAVRSKEAKGKFKNGLLKITVPLKEPMKGFQVPIE